MFATEVRESACGWTGSDPGGDSSQVPIRQQGRKERYGAFIDPDGISVMDWMASGAQLSCRGREALITYTLPQRSRCRWQQQCSVVTVQWYDADARKYWMIASLSTGISPLQADNAVSIHRRCDWEDGWTELAGPGSSLGRRAAVVRVAWPWAAHGRMEWSDVDLRRCKHRHRP